MRRRLFANGLYGRVRAGGRAVRAVLAWFGDGVRVDQAAQEVALRMALAAAAEGRRVRLAARRSGRGENRDRYSDALGFAPPGSPGRSARAAELLGFAPAGRERAPDLAELLGFARRETPARSGRKSEVRRREPEIER